MGNPAKIFLPTMTGTEIKFHVAGTVTDPVFIAGISTVKINLSLLSPLVDPATGNPVRTSLSSTVRLNQ